MTTETLSFGADVSRLLDIVAHALYANRDVFLRELISNASDACDKLRYDAIETPGLIQDDPEFRVRVYKDTEYRDLYVVDNGIGMNREELVDNLGTIAKSGTASLMEQLGSAEDEKDKLSLIGQFGVGFYASFMVADSVQVISRKAGDKQAWHWSSDGKTGFDVREATDEEAAHLMGERGTAILLRIKDNSSEFLIDEKLKQVIQTYSDHINVNIYLGNPNDGELSEDEKDDPSQPYRSDPNVAVNSASALWMRPKSDVKEDEYNSFYKHITMGMDEPLMTSHWRAEGVIEYSSLLYIPTMQPWDLYDPTRRHAVRLYVKRVFISDDVEGLVFPWLRFLRGVVDSQDLPLNISRETLQHNPVVQKMRNGIAKKILGDLDKMSRDDEDKFNVIWGQFGPVIKEGLYDAADHRDDILKVARFFSTHDENQRVSLADYVERMKDGQTYIYYISGENLDTLRNSPQIEGFKARGLEVLFLTDTIDDFWLQSVPQFKEFAFKSVTKGDINLSAFDDKKKGEEPDDKAQADANETEDENIKALQDAIQDVLKEEIEEVRLSTRLTDSPVCLIAGDKGVDLRMERVLKIHQKYEAESKRVLEINPEHPLIQTMAKTVSEDKATAPDMQDAAYLLLDQARIIQGEPVPDPTRFARAMSRYMERGLLS